MMKSSEFFQNSYLELDISLFKICSVYSKMVVCDVGFLYKKYFATSSHLKVCSKILETPCIFTTLENDSLLQCIKTSLINQKEGEVFVVECNTLNRFLLLWFLSDKYTTMNIKFSFKFFQKFSFLLKYQFLKIRKFRFSNNLHLKVLLFYSTI